MYVFLATVFSKESSIVALLLIIAAILSVLIRNRRQPKLYPPGPMSFPIVGNLLQLGLRPHETFAKMRKTYGDIFSLDFAAYRCIILNEPKMIRDAFAMPEFTGRPHLYPFFVRSNGKLRGLIVNDGSSWQEQRRFTMKALRDFGFGKKSMESLIQNEIVELLDSLAKLNGKPFKTQHLFNLAVLNSLWSIITGRRYAHDDEKLVNLVEYIADSIKEAGAGQAFLFFPWLCKHAPEISGFNQYLFHQQKVIDFIRQEAQAHKATFQTGNLRDVLDSNLQKILNTNDPESSFYKYEGEENLVMNLTDLFYAGVETTSTTLSWATLYLALNPQIQDQMFDEIKKVVGLSRLPALADRPNMPYTEAVIIEVLRASSLIPISLFHRATEDVTFYGYKIPKDTWVISNQHAAQNDPAIWGDPENFRPERFINEDGSVNRNHKALLAFSTGKRVCLGESLARDELFLFISCLFQKFSVKPDPAKPKPKIDFTCGFVLMPKPYEYVLSDRC